MMVGMHVLGLGMDEATTAPVLVLQRQDGEETVPFWIGIAEALMLSYLLNGDKTEPSFAHDLLLDAMTALDGHLVGVSITDLQEEEFITHLEIMTAKEIVRLPCRLSDGVALAIRAKIPLLMHVDLFSSAKKQGKTPSSRAADALHITLPDFFPHLPTVAPRLTEHQLPKNSKQKNNRSSLKKQRTVSLRNMKPASKRMM